MKIARLIAIAIPLIATSIAEAQTPYGFDLSWNNCIGLPGAAQNMDYACDGSRDGNPFRLIVTFTPGWNMEHFVGVQVTMEVRTPDSQLPDWWRLGDNECRVGTLVFPGSRNGIGTGASGACINPWAGASDTGGGFQWYSDMRIDCARYGCFPNPRPGYAAFRLAFARDTDVALQAGQRYFIAPILLDPYDPDALCTGCATPACLFVYEVELYQTAGQIPPQQDIYVVRRPFERGFVTWQGGSIGSECSNVVETRRKTWGAIKAIYR